MRRYIVMSVAGLSLFWAGILHAGEYFVAPQGNDTNNGIGLDQAVKTITQGIKLLKPGDTLTVQPGIYPESIRCALEGKPGAPITIRAARPGAAVLEGFVSVPPFDKTPGSQYTYQTRAKVTDKAIVMERRTGRHLRACPNPDAVEQVLGSFYADPAAGLLYLHGTDSQNPTPNDIQVSVHEEGLYFYAQSTNKAAKWLIIDGF